MENLPTVKELKEQRDAYNDEVKAFIEGNGQEFIDKAASAPGIRYVLEKLEETHAKTGPGSYLDMGTGYSTLVVSGWCRERGWKYVGVDHDKPWLRFMQSLVKRVVGELPADERPVLMHRSSFEPHINLSSSRGPWPRYHAMFIDHGPQLDTRAEDTPMLSRLLAPNGIMLFDDWRPKHEGRIRRAMIRAPGNWEVGDGGDAIRRFPRDKSIGWARRKV